MLIARVTMATKTWKGCATNDMTMMTMTMIIWMIMMTRINWMMMITMIIMMRTVMT